MTLYANMPDDETHLNICCKHKRMQLFRNKWRTFTLNCEVFENPVAIVHLVECDQCETEIYTCLHMGEMPRGG